MAKQGGLGVAAVVAVPLILVGTLVAGILLVFGPAQQAGACGRADRALNLARIAARARLSPREAAQNLLCAGECLLARGAQEAGHRAIIQARDAFAAMDMPWFKARAQDLASR